MKAQLPNERIGRDAAQLAEELGDLFYGFTKPTIDFLGLFCLAASSPHPCWPLARGMRSWQCTRVGR